MKHLRRRAMSAGLFVASAVAVWCVAQPSASQLPLLTRQPQSRSESLFADLLAEGVDGTMGTVAPDGRVRTVVAARPGAERALADYASSVGASITFQDDAVGYFELAVPKGALLSFSAHASVEAFELDGQSKAESLARGDVSCVQKSVSWDSRRTLADPTPLTGRTADVLRETGYAALGVDALLREHPTFDGRGVTIAMIDGLTTGLPTSHPAFRTAMDVAGTPIPKIRDMVIVNPTWRSAKATTRTGARATGGGTPAAPILPREGEFLAGVVDTPWQKYDFVWDTSARTVWVDANLNGDFRDDAPLRDARSFPDDVGQFPAAKSVLGVFRVTMEPEQSRVVFHLVSPETSSNHAAMDVAIAAGNDAFIRGVAPGASLVLLDPTDNAFARLSDMIRTLIYAARRPDVDIISMSYSVATSPIPTDDVVSVVSDRLIRKFHKVLITAASNMTWRDVPDAVGMYSVSVGAYMPGEAARYLGAAKDTQAHWILPYSARGPRGDGDARPDVVAPAVWMSLGRCDVPRASSGPCPALSGGTSAAAPALAGAVALLASGAKQRGLQFRGEDMRALLRASAVHIPGLGVDEQGAGLANVAAAWNLLVAQHDWPTLVASSALDDARAGFLSVEGRGRGIYEKSWTVGQSGVAVAVFTRTSGMAGRQRFELDWTGNDGTFKAPRSLDLGLNDAVPVKLEILPRASGIHSALLNVRDKQSGHVLHQAQVTVSADGRPDASPRTGTLQSMGRLGQIVTVPKGTMALRMRLKTDGVANVAATSPSSWSQSPLSLLREARREFGTELVVPQPAAGNWELSAFSDVYANGRATMAYAMSLSVLSMNLREVTKGAAGNVNALIGVSDDPHGSWPREVRGRLALVTQNRRSQVSALQQDVQTVEVGSETRSVVFRATLLNADRGGLSLYVYDCSSKPCRRADVARATSGEAALRFETPHAGHWKVVVLSSDAEPVPYHLDVFAEPVQSAALGRVECRPESADVARCDVSVSATSKRAAAVLFDLNVSDEVLGRVSCRLAYNRPVPVGLVMDLSEALPMATGSGR